MLFISNETFNKYLKQRYFDNIYPFQTFSAKDIILTSFSSWKRNYELNPNAWEFIPDRFSYSNKNHIYFPYKAYKVHHEDIHKVVKFLTKRDYKKFFRYYKRHIERKECLNDK